MPTPRNSPLKHCDPQGRDSRKTRPRRRSARAGILVVLVLAIAGGAMLLCLQHTLRGNRTLRPPVPALAPLATTAHREPLDSAETARGEPAPALPVAKTDRDEIEGSALRRLERATVGVENPTRHTAGSGAIVGYSGPLAYILTAGHLMSKDDVIQVLLLDADGQRVEAAINPAHVVAQDETNDLAVLRCLLRHAPARVPIAALVGTLESTHALTAGWSMASKPVIVPVGNVTEHWAERPMGKAIHVWQSAGELVRGRSGGPLVNSHGDIIGVASGTSGGNGYFAHLGEIHHFLRVNGLSWLLNRAPQD